MTQFIQKEKKPQQTSNNKMNLCRQQYRDGKAKGIVFTLQADIFLKELDNVNPQRQPHSVKNWICSLAFGRNLALKFKMIITQGNQKCFCFCSVSLG